MKRCFSRASSCLAIAAKSWYRRSITWCRLLIKASWAASRVWCDCAMFLGQQTNLVLFGFNISDNGIHPILRFDHALFLLFDLSFAEGVDLSGKR